MGLLDFLFKKEPAKPMKVHPPSAVSQKKTRASAQEQHVPSSPLKESKTNALEQCPPVAPSNEEKDSTLEICASITPQKELEVNDTVQCSVSRPEVDKKPLIKVTNCGEIENSIQYELEADDLMLELYCPVRPAKIFCHSVLIDKLGDLTKFIISSLYGNHSIKEVSDLTQMGTTTIKEEIEYLVRGGLINDDGESLTDLGLQYGRLLEMFDELSEGIAVAFNMFANIFEPIEMNGYYSEADLNYVLPNNFIPTLARNDNYANSLDIAIKNIEEDVPFCKEIKKSLYATVKIDKVKPGLKKVSISSLGSGLKLKATNEACVKIVIPYDRILYKARYSWIDPYRNEIATIEGLNATHDDLLSPKAKAIIASFFEETTAEIIMVEINTITGEPNNRCDTLIELSSEELRSDEPEYILDRYKAKAILNPETCKGIYLEEVSREELYKIVYCPYSQMEVQ